MAPPEAEARNIAPTDQEPVGNGAAVWLELEPEDLSDATKHTLNGATDGISGWRILAASRRGKIHAHEGSYRDDAFEYETISGWHAVAVADGAGSCRLSRVGAGVACRAALEAMRKTISEASGEAIADTAKRALAEGVSAAHQAVQAEADRRSVAVKELSTTLLLLLHYPKDGGDIVGVLEIGDGIVAIKGESADGLRWTVYDAGAHGEYSGETLFLQSRPSEQWLDGARVETYERGIRLLAVMTDGIADDLLPYEKNLRILGGGLDEKVLAAAADQQADELLNLISYDRRGSFDDRTLVVIYRVQDTPTPDEES
jgi:serine/threonine protein phosphatase PrpC